MCAPYADVEAAADGDDPMTVHMAVDPIDPVILDRFTQLAAQVLDVPVVCVSMVDDFRRKSVNSYGLGAPGRGGPLTPALGIHLLASDGRPVGTLTVMDRQPFRWSTPQLEFLRELTVRLVAQVDVGPVERMM
jgi:GAF domain-containing protein